MLEISSGFLNPYWSNYNHNFRRHYVVVLKFSSDERDYIRYEKPSIDY